MSRPRRGVSVRKASCLCAADHSGVPPLSTVGVPGRAASMALWGTQMQKWAGSVLPKVYGRGVKSILKNPCPAWATRLVTWTAPTGVILPVGWTTGASIRARSAGLLPVRTMRAAVALGLLPASCLLDGLHAELPTEA